MIEKFKNSFSPNRNRIHLNNSGVSPISTPARQAADEWARRLYDEGDACFGDGFAMVEETRRQLARFLGAHPEETIFFGTTAVAISQVALGLTLNAGDEIIVWDQEYPSNFYPWKVAADRVGAKLIVAKSEPSLATPVMSLQRLISEKTKVVAFSWIQYRTGAAADIAAITKICRERGIFTCADIIQGAGVLPFDFEKSGLDAACGGSHKWMTSPIGVGYLLLKKARMTQVSPIAVGAFSFGTSEDLSSIDTRMKDDFGRFEPGAKNLLELAGFGASLRLFNETGIAAITTEARRLSDRLRLGLEGLGYRLNSPNGVIVNFSGTERSPMPSVEQIAQSLQNGRISFGLRPPGIRLSPHAFNSEAEIDRVLQILENARQQS